MPNADEKTIARSIEATVLFADLVGFGVIAEQVGSERAYGVVTGCLRALEDIARRHGAAIDKAQGDSLMAVFGHPVQLPAAAHAACQAAAAMRRRVAETARELPGAAPLTLRVGIDSGPMVAGSLRGAVAREFHVLGNPVNVAARLKARAPEEGIYVGAATRSAVGPGFEFAALSPLMLKGRSLRIEAFALGDPGPAACSWGVGAAPMPARARARERELGLLRRRADAARRGTGAVVTLTGEAGSGRSELLAELADEADLRALRVSPSAAQEQEPLQLFFGLARELGCPREAAAIEGALAALAREQTLLLVFDSLEGADAGSLALIERLGRQTASLAILLVFLGDDDSPVLTRVADGLAGPQLERIRLETLAAEAAGRLVDAVAATNGLTLDPALRARILARGGGQPGRLVLATHLAQAIEAEDGTAAGAAGATTERVRATILYADLTGFTAMTERMGPEAAYPIVADCLEIMSAVTRRHGGTVHKYLGDCVMAVFGVPAAIEDAPRAAVNAAIEMRRRVRAYAREHALKMPLDVHTGIHTGPNIAGDVSGPLLREFAVMGEPVVVATALTDAAPSGEIMAGPETRRSTAGHFEYGHEEELRIAGRAEPLPCYRLRSDTERLYRARLGVERPLFSELVGRGRELDVLRDRFERLTRGEGGFVSLVGEAGLGKSRLMAELAREVGERATWLEARSLAAAGTGYQPFTDLVRTWAGIAESDAEAEARGRLEALVDRVAPGSAHDTLPVIARLCGLAPSDAPASAQAPGGDPLARLAQASMSELLRRASDQHPLVIAFEDLHWADLSSIELLESLLGLVREHPVLLLLAFRPWFPATSGRIQDALLGRLSERGATLELQPLGPDAVRHLVNNLFAGAEIPRRARTRIVTASQGNPFYVEEIARSLLESGAIEPTADGFRATPRIDDTEIPGSVQEVIQTRVDRLAARPRDVLQLASVLGLGFPLTVLRAVVGAPESLDADLESLTLDGFLREPEASSRDELAFKHPLIQEVTYERQLETQRRDRHLAVARALETTLTPDRPGYHATLAYHLSRGGDLDRAEPALFRAGDEAARSAATSEALRFFQEASRLYLELHPGGGDPRRRAQLEKNIALALYNRGQLMDAEAHFDEALRALGERVPRTQLERSVRFGWKTTGVLARLFLPSRRRRAAEQLDREVIALMMKRAEAQILGSPTRFLFDSIETLARLDGVDPRTVAGAGGFYAGTVGIFSYAGLSFAVARRFLERAAPLVREDDVGESVFFGMMNHLHHFLTGDWDERHRLPESLLDAGLSEMHLWPVTNYLGLEAEQRIRTGDFEKARMQMTRIDAIWERFNYDLAKTNHYWLPTLLALEQRRLPDTIDAAGVYFDENPEDLLHILALSCMGQAQALEGELGAARATLERAAAIVARAKYPPPFHTSAFATARLQLDLAALEAGDGAPRSRAIGRSLRAALTVARRVAYRAPEVYRLAGRAAWLRGRRKRAIRWWERSLASADALGLRPERARMAAELAVRLAASPQDRVGGRDAPAWRGRAAADLEALGLREDLRRLETGTPP